MRDRYYDDMRNDGAPDYRSLSTRTTTRRGAAVQCDMCRTAISPGQRYRTDSYLLDGKFQMSRNHLACPPDADEIRHAEEDRRRQQENDAYDAMVRDMQRHEQRGVKKALATGIRYHG